MKTKVKSNSIVVSRNEVRKRGGVVILDLKEYEQLLERAVPTYYLQGKEAEELDELVREGMREYEAGETIKAPSIKEALKIYDRQHRKKR